MSNDQTRTADAKIRTKSRRLARQQKYVTREIDFDALAREISAPASR